MIGYLGSTGRLGLQARQVTTRLLLYPNYVQNYLDRVTAADVAAGNTLGLELAVTDAISTCLQGMVSDGVLGVSGNVLAQAASVIKASCIMAGARTLSGSLVPLAADMPAPTNINFVSGDYNRKTGLGDPANASKYLNANRAPIDDPQDNAHIATFVTSVASAAARHYIGATRTTAPASFSQIIDNNGQLSFAINTATGINAANIGNTLTGFFGVTRSAATVSVGRAGGVNYNSTGASAAPSSLNHFVFCRNLNGSPSGISDRRHSFYSVGQGLNLALLDARMTTLMNALAAAIP